MPIDAVNQTFTDAPPIAAKGRIANRSINYLIVPVKLGTAASPGDAVYYSQSNDDWRVPGTDNLQRGVEGIVGLDESQPETAYASGDRDVPVILGGCVWVEAGEAVHFGSLLHFDYATGERDWKGRDTDLSLAITYGGSKTGSNSILASDLTDLTVDVDALFAAGYRKDILCLDTGADGGLVKVILPLYQRS